MNLCQRLWSLLSELGCQQSGCLCRSWKEKTWGPDSTKDWDIISSQYSAFIKQNWQETVLEHKMSGKRPLWGGKPDNWSWMWCWREKRMNGHSCVGPLRHNKCWEPINACHRFTHQDPTSSWCIYTHGKLIYFWGWHAFLLYTFTCLLENSVSEDGREWKSGKLDQLFTFWENSDFVHTQNEEKSQQIIQPSWFSLFCCHMLLVNCTNPCVNAGSIFKGASNSKGFPELNNTSGSEAALKSSTSNELNGECETNWDLSQEEEESECGHEKMSSQATADDQEGDE